MKRGKRVEATPGCVRNMFARVVCAKRSSRVAIIFYLAGLQNLCCSPTGFVGPKATCILEPSKGKNNAAGVQSPEFSARRILAKTRLLLDAPPKKKH